MCNAVELFVNYNDYSNRLHNTGWLTINFGIYLVSCFTECVNHLQLPITNWGGENRGIEFLAPHFSNNYSVLHNNITDFSSQIAPEAISENQNFPGGEACPHILACIPRDGLQPPPPLFA